MLELSPTQATSLFPPYFRKRFPGYHADIAYTSLTPRLNAQRHITNQETYTVIQIACLYPHHNVRDRLRLQSLA